MKSTRHAEPSPYHNLFHTFAILLAMGGLFGLLGWMIFGLAGLIMAVILAGLVLISTPRITPPLILKMYGARQFTLSEAPGLYGISTELARRAGLPSAPLLYYIPSSVMNAFSVGSRESSAIALSDRLVRFLSPRELTAVLAHEISHISNNDLRLHAFADMMTRITSMLSFIGQLLILLYLPVMFLSAMRIPFFLIFVLIFTPTASMLLQLALSRNREFVADTTAVFLTKDPEGLASALQKMDRYEKKFWELLVLPGKRMPNPSLMRTHPNTGDRVERIMRMEPEGDRRLNVPDEGVILPENIPVVKSTPGWNPLQPWR